MTAHFPPSLQIVAPSGGPDGVASDRGDFSVPIPSARARRTPRLVAITVIGMLGLGACGGDAASTAATADPAGTAASTPATTGSGPATTAHSIADDVVDRPTVESLPSVPVTDLVVTEIVPGEGAESVVGDTVVVDYVGVRSADGTEFDNSYDRGEPIAVGPLGSASVIAGWDQGLLGVREGQTLQLDIPNELAYGDEAQGDIIQAGDDLSFVIDVLAVIPGAVDGQAPDIATVEPSTGTAAVTTAELVEGDGEEAVEGSNVAVQYLAFNGADGTLVDSGWEFNTPLVLTLGDNTYLDGFDEGILGMRVGGRRQVVIPGELAFGAEGNSSLGIPAGADLVMIFDLIAIF